MIFDFSYSIFVLSVLESLLEELLCNGFRLTRLRPDRGKLQNCENQMCQVVVFRCTRQHFLECLQLVFILDQVEVLDSWNIVVVEGGDGIFIGNAGVQENAVVQRRLEITRTEIFRGVCDDAVVFFIGFFSFLFFLFFVVICGKFVVK